MNVWGSDDCFVALLPSERGLVRLMLGLFEVTENGELSGIAAAVERVRRRRIAAR